MVGALRPQAGSLIPGAHSLANEEVVVMGGDRE